MFASNSRRIAKAQETASFNSMRSAADAANKARQDYMNQFGERNKGMLEMQARTFGRIAGFDRGADIGQLFAGQSAVLNAGADAAKNLQRLTGGMGASALMKSDRFTRKLEAVGNRALASQVGRGLQEGALTQYGQDIGTAMQSSQFLNADRLAGISGLGQSVSDYANVGNAASRILQSERTRGEAMWGRIMGIAQLGLGAALGFASIPKPPGSGSTSQQGSKPSGSNTTSGQGLGVGGTWA